MGEEKKFNDKSLSKSQLSRRNFIKKTGSVLAGISIVPRYVLGGAGKVSPSEKVSIGYIGVGSQGVRVLTDFLRQSEVQIVSVCDVNTGSDDFKEWGKGEMLRRVREVLGDNSWGRFANGGLGGLYPGQDIVQRYYAKERGAASYDGCTAYTDYRELLEKEKDIDAVVVCTADHSHAIISAAAMKAGKHVYCQKPMTHSVYEARKLAEAARECKVATQVATGNQASEDTRLLCEWIWDGAIGPVREVHNWSDRPLWPQGLDRPDDTPPVPPILDWDLWLGPAPYRPYHPAYLPFVWRGWYDFGTGALGDMGCYSFDTIFRVLKLGPPTTVEATSTKRYKETYPAASIVRYEFPARGDIPPVNLTWYDGGLMPPRPDELGENRALGREGLLFIGDEGKILCGFSGAKPRLIPDSKMKAYKQPPKTLPRSPGHDEEWIGACKGGKPAGANFEVAGPITETLLLGNVALRTRKKLRWDGPNMKVTNVPEVNKYIANEYREGWSL